MAGKCKHKTKKLVLGLVFILLIVIIAGCAWYLSDYYHAAAEVSDYLQGSCDLTITKIDDGLFIDGSGTEDALIFYPGAKVEYTAYAPLMCLLAENGVDVFLIKMPCNLAILGVNKADDIIDEYNYAHWYIGGHSLGGAMAASYAAEHDDEDTKLTGLILLAAYPTKNLGISDLHVLTVYGSEDGVLNMTKIADGRELMPEDYTELVIEGGNHAQFGCYGEQSGDGAATISASEQRQQTVNAILALVEEVGKDCQE